MDKSTIEPTTLSARLPGGLIASTFTGRPAGLPATASNHARTVYLRTEGFGLTLPVPGTASRWTIYKRPPKVRQRRRT